MRIIGINANGISSKLDSLTHIISDLNPSIICLQETKLRKMGKLQYKGYTIFELIRKQSAGGGLAILTKSDLEPIWVSEGDDEVEILVIEVHIENYPIKIINAYCPQESDSIERKASFWARLHTEVNDAIESNIGVVLQMDGNLHAGETIIKGDPNSMNNNGKLFEAFLKNNPAMTLLNASEKCEGKLTRKRIKAQKTEEAILDFTIVSDCIAQYFKKMVIDEAREHPLTSYINKKPKNSDHFTLIMDFDINFKKNKPVRNEVFNFLSSECQETFKEILNTENNLINCFNHDGDINEQTDIWFSSLNKIFTRCFKKIRVNNKIKETETTKLFKKKSELTQLIKKNPNSNELKEELEAVIEEITKLVSKENCDKIFENFKMLDQSDGVGFSQGIWKIKNKQFLKISASVPAAKLNANGNMISDPNSIKKLYLETFTHRLRQRPPKQEYVELIELQQRLLEKRLLLSMDDKSPPWSEQNILDTLNSLKNGKCRDPLGLVNEIFKPPIAGADLIKSLTILMNRIKDECVIPDLFRLKNITTIYKNKGSRYDLQNDRGIFTCTVFNTILQKLIYNDKYDIIGKNLSDSNVGARKNRNHTFIINGIINEVIQSKSESVDLTILDYKQCFDSLSVDITLNDLFEAGVKDNILNVISESDASSNVAIKTPLGITKRAEVKKFVAQRDVNSNLKCTVTVDSMSQNHTKNLNNHLYEYRNQVPIPPLGMVDDQIAVSKC